MGGNTGAMQRVDSARHRPFHPWFPWVGHSPDDSSHPSRGQGVAGWPRERGTPDPAVRGTIHSNCVDQPSLSFWRPNAGRDGGLPRRNRELPHRGWAKWVVGLTGSRMGRCKAQFCPGCPRERAPGSLPGSLAYPRARSRLAFGSNCFLRQSASGSSVYAHVVLCIRTAWRGPGAHVGVA